MYLICQNCLTQPRNTIIDKKQLVDIFQPIFDMIAKFFFFGNLHLIILNFDYSWTVLLQSPLALLANNFALKCPSAKNRSLIIY